MSKDIFTKKDLQINSQKKKFTNKSWKKHIIQTKTLKRKYVPKILGEKSVPKIHCREIRTENLKRVIPVQTNFEEKFLRKNIWRESRGLKDITTKKYVTQFSAKEPLKRHSPCQKLGKRNLHEKKQNMFAKIVLTISLPRTLWREIYTKQISAVTSTEKKRTKHFYHNPPEGKSLQNNFQKKNLPKNIPRKIYKTNIYRKILTKTMSKDIFTTKYLQIKSQKKSLTHKSWKKHIIQTKTLKRKYVPKIFEEKSLPKIHCREMCAENLRRGILDQTNIEEKLLPKNISRESIYQEIFEEKSLPKNMWQSALPRAPQRDIPCQKLEGLFGRGFFQIFFGSDSFPVFWYLCSLQSFVWIICSSKFSS